MKLVKLNFNYLNRDLLITLKNLTKYRDVLKKISVSRLILKELLNNKQGVILDIEGVIVKGIETPTPFEDALELLKYIKEKGLEIVLLTNLARISTTRVARKLNEVLEGEVGTRISREMIVNPTIAAIEGYLAEMEKKPVNVFLISEGGHVEDILFYDWINIVYGEEADYVLLGADRTLNYWKLNTAFRLLRKGKKLLVLGGDLYSEGVFYDIEGEYIMEGAIAKALEAATGVKGIITGKPSRLAFNTALKKLNLKPDKVLMIGDNLEKDIIGAATLGVDGLYINRNKSMIIKLPNIIEDINASIYLSDSLIPDAEVKIFTKQNL